MKLLKITRKSIECIAYLLLFVVDLGMLLLFCPWWQDLDRIAWGSKSIGVSACFESLESYYMCCYQNMLLIGLPVIVSLIVRKKYPKISIFLLVLPILTMSVQVFG